MKSLPEFYEKMLLIRFFEERVLKLFELGKLAGTTHTYIGQEANAVGIISNLLPADIIYSNHRNHGHFIAFTNDLLGLLCEIMGKERGVSRGRGGSQHVHAENFYANGVQGGIVPCAAGIAFAEKLLRKNSVTTVFLGDGTLGQGVVYETLNIAAKWNLPILFVVENNLYAQSTHIEQTLSGNIADRAAAFGIPLVYVGGFENLDAEFSHHIKDLNLLAWDNHYKSKDLFRKIRDYNCHFSIRKKGQVFFIINQT